jgi:hypothetical protein
MLALGCASLCPCQHRCVCTSALCAAVLAVVFEYVECIAQPLSDCYSRRQCCWQAASHISSCSPPTPLTRPVLRS